MTTKHITTIREQDVCDICGRTLLRGEQSEAFLDGHRRYSVCELCKPHALHEGWVREGTIPDYQGLGGYSARRRSLLGRFRSRGGALGGADAGGAAGLDDDEFAEDREARGARGDGARGRRGRRSGNGRIPEDEQPQPPQTLDDELSLGTWPPPEPISAPMPELEDELPPEMPEPAPARRGRARAQRRSPGRDSAREQGARGARAARGQESRGQRPEPGREPRRVHAVPTGEAQKIAAALNVFNRTEHTRTVASVSRSLGVPGINVTPDPAHTTIVRVVATWELCWYRYEVDLSDDPGSVRLDGQGYELGELAEHELAPNAAADEAGRLYYE